MKAALLSLSLFASNAFALGPLPVSSEMDENAASAADRAVDPVLEAQRMKDIEAAKKTGDQVQFMTPAEIVEDMREEGYQFAEEEDDRDLLIEKSQYGGGGALNIDIDISSQRLNMWGTQTPAFSEPISSAKPGYRTVRGIFHPIRLERMWYSRKYDLSPMPFSVFFSGGYALHQTPYVKLLGRPASHGCVRQSGRGARYVYETVRYYVSSFGRRSVTIRVHD